MYLAFYNGDHFKCVEDSGEIKVHKKITRFVGQNEAGKTSLLELLNILRSIVNPEAKFVLEDYPRSKFNQYKKNHETKPHKPVSATFQIEPAEIAKIEKKFGAGVLPRSTLTISKVYDSKALHYSLSVDEHAYIKHFVGKLSLDEELKAMLEKAQTINDLKNEVAKLNEEHRKIADSAPSNLSLEIFNDLNVPYFFYFDEYAALPGEISLNKLKQFAAGKYKGEDSEALRTAKALVDFAGAEIEEFLNKDNYERLRADLEAASNEITDQLNKFWTTNPNLEIRFELQPVLNENNTLIDTTLHVRVFNTRHRVTVPFEKRSKGFVWFFSFLVAFSEHKNRTEEIILLLDEPGLNLGAVAQRDLMRYFEEELAPHHQILYTTHSPFMIDPRQLDTVRTVEDETVGGTKVSNDPCRHKSETLFPLQAALGYDLTQTFFVAPNNLLVEGPGDLIYLNLASQILARDGAQGLDEAWTIVPVGGADKVASFVSLLGAQGLKLAAFMDVAEGDAQRFQSVLKNKLMLKRHLITVGSVLQRAEADIEDLFSPSSFLKLVSKSYSNELKGKPILEADLAAGSPRLAKRLEVYFASNGINRGKFNHYKPAFDLMNHPEWQDEVFDAQTKENFGKAFILLNSALIEESASELNALPARKLRSQASLEVEANA